jgi:hypothetical protein
MQIKRRESMRLIVTTLFVLVLYTSIGAQEGSVSPDQALELFKAGNYSEALPMYQQLIERYDRDPKYNYYLGICLVEQHQNNSEAIKRLKFSLSRRINQDVHYYLGKAYQNAYQFDLASKEFSTFLKYAANSDPRRARAQRAVDDCGSGKNLINKHFSINVINKDTVNEADLLSAYDLPGEAGTLTRNKSFFKTGVPPENIMYRTEKGDDVYFVLEENDTTTHDIYMMEQLLDRWSGSKNLRKPVNSDYDDRCPFLMADGTTFFFASDRPGGLGGLDIYRSILDPESNTFSEPENLGPPFNSPADDYLFAPDVFDKRAWFTTTRGVEPGKVVVVKIAWDNSVIKNLTDNTEQIKELSDLPLSEEILWKEKTAQTEQKKSNIPVSDSEQFNFRINDTLVYTNYDQFLSDAARGEFKRGQSIDMKKDSLEQLMKNKRERYAQSYDQDELNQLMNEILELEKTVYGHNDQIKRYYIRARQLENDKISELIDQGQYNRLQPKTSHGTIEKSSVLAPLNPGNYSFYSDEEFRERKERLTPMYQKYFNPAQIKTLQRTDSMYTWANILKLEASKLLEQSVTYSNKSESQENRSLIEKIKNLDSLKGEETSEEPEKLSRKARELQKQALDMYHEALDKKFNIYKPKLEQLIENSDQGELDIILGKSQSYFEEANNSLEKMQTWNPERYEQLGGLKRKGIEMIETGLLNYSSATPSSNPNTKHEPKSKGNIQKNYQNIQNNRRNGSSVKISKDESATVQQPNKIVENAFGINSPNEKQAQKPVFKIQIGVFRNTPDAEALAAIPKISSEPVPGKGLTKYYAGEWSNYEDASAHIAQIRQNGFSGAFVVAFLNGKQISVNDAKAINKKG